MKYVDLTIFTFFLIISFIDLKIFFLSFYFALNLKADLQLLLGQLGCQGKFTYVTTTSFSLLLLLWPNEGGKKENKSHFKCLSLKTF